MPLVYFYTNMYTKTKTIYKLLLFFKSNLLLKPKHYTKSGSHLQPKSKQGSTTENTQATGIETMRKYNLVYKK